MTPTLYLALHEQFGQRQEIPRRNVILRFALTAMA